LPKRVDELFLSGTRCSDRDVAFVAPYPYGLGLAALEKFAGMETAQVQAVTFEIAMLGRRGLNVNDAAQRYELASLPGSFSGLQLVSMMYVGFKQIAPEMDVGFDLSQEYDAARQLFVSSEPNP
jgi:hypothetical protein